MRVYLLHNPLRNRLAYYLTAKALPATTITQALTRAKQIFMVHEVEGFGTHWRNNPAVTMWTPALGQLASIGLALCVESIRRGYACQAYLDYFKERQRKYKFQPLPNWWTIEILDRYVANSIEAHKASVTGHRVKDIGTFWPQLYTGPAKLIKAKPSKLIQSKLGVAVVPTLAPTPKSSKLKTLPGQGEVSIIEDGNEPASIEVDANTFENWRKIAAANGIYF